jgi:D-alanyl-D-alanine carboxypeptidase
MSRPSRSGARRGDLPTPPYGLRRLIALLLVVILVLLVWRSGVIGAFFGSGGTKASATDTTPGPSRTPEATPSTNGPRVAVPDCSTGKVLTAYTSYQDWWLTMLDFRYRLNEDYVPPDLVSAMRAGFAKRFLVRELLIDDLTALREASAKAGRRVDIVAAYRSFDQQAALYNLRRESGDAGLLADTAVPGHSEHQLGTTIDFKSAGAADVDVSWAQTNTGRWMANNAWKFGFVMSYPKGERGVTCYPWEPWHFRYFGPEIAQRIHDSRMTVREFLWTLQPAKKL